MNPSLLQKLAHLFAGGLNLDKDVVKRLKEPTVNGHVEYIKSDACKNIIVMVGAGISTSAGIPDFRSPGSGLYDNLQQYNLPSPESMFDIDFFQSNPEPFFHLARELIPENLKPTPCHFFLKLLHDKGLLMRCYSQNIDDLESVAGLPSDKVVAAHGSFHSSHCLNKSCRKEYNYEWMRDKIRQSEEVPKCETCKSVVKPDIVFFGEMLPRRFFTLSEQDFPLCDLLIVIGTSLTVHPFASLVELVPKDVPRLAINLTPFRSSSRFELLTGGGGWKFDSPDNYRDVFMQGTSDEKCRELARLLDWEKELDDLIQNH
jgi:NAD-dependent deacetylase sirtuin 2